MQSASASTQASLSVEIDSVRTQSRVVSGKPGYSVLVLDLLPTVPYYTGHLCAAMLGIPDMTTRLASMTYAHDLSCFRKLGVKKSALVDWSWKIPKGFSRARKVVKLLEYLVNLVSVAIQVSIRRVQLVHVQFTPLLELGLPFERWLLQFCRWSGIKLVYTAHNLLPHDSSRRHLSRYVRLYQMMDGIICHSDTARERLISEFGVSADKISVICHGPMFSSESPVDSEGLRKRLGVSDGECLVLWQGIIRPYKGIPFLLHVWKKAIREGLRAKLVIVGTGERSQLDGIKDLVSELKLNHSVVLDFRFVSTEEVAELQASADIVVYPYASITTSGALMTATGHSKAVIASALAGFQDVLQHEENALLVPYGEIDAWADALVRLAADPEMRNKLAEQLSETQAHVPGWDKIAEQTAGLYRSVITPAVLA